jgi:CRISPR/Cas system CSM-associated protein Csm3 (group 7 of RAMP superfamily)
MSAIVPFTKRPLSLRACADESGHERRNRNQSGIWTCLLTTETPLCIQSSFRNLKDTDKPALPASSLRGMARNMVEVLGAGCARFYEGAGSPSALDRCTERKACIACRIFGFVSGDFAWAGKVRFNDTLPAAVKWAKYNLPSQRPPQAPGTGWILFPHTPVALAPGATRCVDIGGRFQFRAEYLNLDPEELAVFQFALTLRYDSPSRGAIDLVHKLGYGKSLGLGACKVRIAKAAAVGAEIESYLSDPAFDAVLNARKI